MLNYYIDGSGPPIVLLHGMIGSARYWDKYVPLLADSHTVIRIDLLGFGDSPKPRDNEYTPSDHVVAIHETLQSLNLTEPFILVGHSMGAIIAMHYATEYVDQVSRLVLVSLPLYRNEREASSLIVKAGVVPKMMVEGRTARVICGFMCTFRPLAQRLVPFYHKDVPRYIAVDGTKHTWYSYSRSLKHIIKQQDVGILDRLSMPAHILIGEHDSIMQSDNFSHLPSNIKLSIVADATHQLPLEKPQEIIAAITSK